jgi:hypothetical protein
MHCLTAWILHRTNARHRAHETLHILPVQFWEDNPECVCFTRGSTLKKVNCFEFCFPAVIISSATSACSSDRKHLRNFESSLIKSKTSSLLLNMFMIDLIRATISWIFFRMAETESRGSRKILTKSSNNALVLAPDSSPRANRKRR